MSLEIDCRRTSRVWSAGQASSAAGARGASAGRDVYSGPAPESGGAHRPLPGPAARPDSRRLHLPARSGRSLAVAAEKLRPLRRRSHRRRAAGELGRERASARRLSRRVETAQRRHQLDHQPRQRFPRATAGRDGRRAGAAAEGRAGRQARLHPAGASRRRSGRDRHQTGGSERDLRAAVQPRLDLGPGALLSYPGWYWPPDSVMVGGVCFGFCGGIRWASTSAVAGAVGAAGAGIPAGEPTP